MVADRPDIAGTFVAVAAAVVVVVPSFVAAVSVGYFVAEAAAAVELAEAAAAAEDRGLTGPDAWPAAHRCLKSEKANKQFWLLLHS